MSAQKVTEKWKTEIEASYEMTRENYYDDDDLITQTTDFKRSFSRIRQKSD
ncbi:MAG: hypothetical protein MZV64_20830 [Ignavibacteriales bacterium]|nr:hypothetical protein [Ignavibacteriales bacterium]